MGSMHPTRQVPPGSVVRRRQRGSSGAAAGPAPRRLRRARARAQSCDRRLAMDRAGCSTSRQDSPHSTERSRAAGDGPRGRLKKTQPLPAALGSEEGEDCATAQPSRFRDSRACAEEEAPPVDGRDGAIEELQADRALEGAVAFAHAPNLPGPCRQGGLRCLACAAGQRWHSCCHRVEHGLGCHGVCHRARKLAHSPSLRNKSGSLSKSDPGNTDR